MLLSMFLGKKPPPFPQAGNPETGRRGNTLQPTAKAFMKRPGEY